MKLEDIERLIKGGESEILEFKRSTGQRTSAAKTLCAMLNGSGGMPYSASQTKATWSGRMFRRKP